MTYLLPEKNERGDIRCPHDREYIANTCWKCGMARAAAESFYANCLDLIHHNMAEQLVEAKALNRQLKEEQARMFLLEGGRMQQLTLRYRELLGKAMQQGMGAIEGGAMAMGQTLGEMGYSTPASDAKELGL